MKMAGSMITGVLSFVLLGFIRAVACPDVADKLPLDVSYKAESEIDFEIMTASLYTTVENYRHGRLITVLSVNEDRILKADEHYQVLDVGMDLVGLLLVLVVCSAMYRWSRTSNAGKHLTENVAATWTSLNPSATTTFILSVTATLTPVTTPTCKVSPNTANLIKKDWTIGPTTVTMSIATVSTLRAAGITCKADPMVVLLLKWGVTLAMLRFKGVHQGTICTDLHPSMQMIFMAYNAMPPPTIHGSALKQEVNG